MTGFIAVVATLAAYLAPDVVSEPRVCNGCGHTVTRLTRTQYTQVIAEEPVKCRRRRCDGRLWAASGSGTGRLLEDLDAHPTNTTGDNPS